MRTRLPPCVEGRQGAVFDSKAEGVVKLQCPCTRIARAVEHVLKPVVIDIVLSEFSTSTKDLPNVAIESLKWTNGIGRSSSQSVGQVVTGRINSSLLGAMTSWMVAAFVPAVPVPPPSSLYSVPALGGVWP